MILMLGIQQTVSHYLQVKVQYNHNFILISHPPSLSFLRVNKMFDTTCSAVIVPFSHHILHLQSYTYSYSQLFSI